MTVVEVDTGVAVLLGMAVKGVGMVATEMEVGAVGVVVMMVVVEVEMGVMVGVIKSVVLMVVVWTSAPARRASP